MRIRRCASRLLGSSPALPLFELPPPSPPPHRAAGSVAAPAASSSSPADPCVLSLSPWDLMGQLRLSDPQEEKVFLETYSVAVAWRASWLFQPSMPAAGSIKEEEQWVEDMGTVDMVDGVIFELRVAGRKRARKKHGSKPKKGEAKEEAEGSDAGGGGGGGARVWTCKKKGGRGWSCRRPVSRPGSLCPYHSEQKLLRGAKPRKRAADYAGEGFYYYAGFGSRGKRHRVSSGTGGGGVPAEPSPAGPKEEAPPDDPEEHIGLATGQAKADGAGHEAAPLAHVDNRTSSWENGMAGIAGCDVAGSGDVKRKSPSLKKRWRKPVKARSLKSLM